VRVYAKISRSPATTRHDKPGKKGENPMAKKAGKKGGKKQEKEQ
jgi:hypothetical protein